MQMKVCEVRRCIVEHLGLREIGLVLGLSQKGRPDLRLVRVG